MLNYNKDGERKAQSRDAVAAQPAPGNGDTRMSQKGPQAMRLKAVLVWRPACHLFQVCAVIAACCCGSERCYCCGSE